MKHLIERLDKWIKEQRPDYYKWLQTGVSENAIIQFEKSLGISISEDFKEFYRWKNGQNISYCSSNFDPFVDKVFLSLEDIINRYTYMKEGEIINPQCKGMWKEKWIPFLENGTGNYYEGLDYMCIDVDDSTGKQGQIFQYFWGIYWGLDKPDITINFTSLKDWLEDLVLKLESNTWQDIMCKIEEESRY